MHSVNISWECHTGTECQSEEMYMATALKEIITTLILPSKTMSSEMCSSALGRTPLLYGLDGICSLLWDIKSELYQFTEVAEVD